MSGYIFLFQIERRLGVAFYVYVYIFTLNRAVATPGVDCELEGCITLFRLCLNGDVSRRANGHQTLRSLLIIPQIYFRIFLN